MSGEKDVWSVTVCAAPAEAGSHKQTNSAAVVAPTLDKSLDKSSTVSLGGHAAAQAHGDSAAQTPDRATEAEP